MKHFRTDIGQPDHSFLSLFGVLGLEHRMEHGRATSQNIPVHWKLGFTYPKGEIGESASVKHVGHVVGKILLAYIHK